MGAVRNRVQTADKNITIHNMTRVHQVMPCEVKSCVFVINKYIKKFLTSNHCFQLKYKSSNITFFSEKWKSEAWE